MTCKTWSLVAMPLFCHGWYISKLGEENPQLLLCDVHGHLCKVILSTWCPYTLFGAVLTLLSVHFLSTSLPPLRSVFDLLARRTFGIIWRFFKAFSMVSLLTLMSLWDDYKFVPFCKRSVFFLNSFVLFQHLFSQVCLQTMLRVLMICGYGDSAILAGPPHTTWQQKICKNQKDSDKTIWNKSLTYRVLLHKDMDKSKNSTTRRSGIKILVGMIAKFSPPLL